MSKNINFKPKARLLLQLGDQLIKNESVALFELVKNSYDADAKNVSVVMKNFVDPSKGTIIIEDDGDGMDTNIIEKVWMEPGSNYKEKIFQKNQRSKLNRLPIGEKGIGRFGVHKLGNKIEIITKMIGKKEVVFNIDWSDFSKADYLGDVNIEIIEREPVIFNNNKKGTKIIISDLKSNWTRGSIRNLYRSINSLCSPFESIDSFKVKFDIDKTEWLENLTTFENIKEFSLFEASIELSGSSINYFEYKFTPWELMDKLSKNEYKSSSEIKLIKNVKVKQKNTTEIIDLSKYKIGNVKIKLYIFDRDSKTLELGITDKQGFKDYLNENGGIRIYRDGMRIFDYGEKENDWLALDYGRFNAPGFKISNNLVIGAIELDRETSSELIEKTNREGFIENEAYLEFKEAVSFAISKVERLRRIDKDKIRTYYSPTSKSEPVIANLNLLQNSIDKKVKDETVKKELSNYVKRIEADYTNITEIYIKSAGAGLSLSVAIHEMEKIIHELTKAADFEKASQRVIELVKRLSQLVEGYSSLVKGKDKKNNNIDKLIEAALFNVEYRITSHNFTIIQGYKNYEKSNFIKCAKNLVISMIVNIIDNSLWWAEYNNVNERKLYIGISDIIPDHISIIIADNGIGFSLPTQDIVKPFISDRPEGVGLGLYLANEIMKGHGGKLFFPEYSDIDLEKEFKNGAIIGLAFKEEK